MDLPDFLLARIAEDEAVAAEVAEIEETFFDSPPKPDHSLYAESDGATWRPAASMGRHRLLAECEAKRRIVERMSALGAHFAATGRQMPDMDSALLVDGFLADLALPYAGHPSYDESWRP